MRDTVLVHIHAAHFLPQTNYPRRSQKWRGVTIKFNFVVLFRLNSTSLKDEYVAIRDAFQKEVRPVWKKEFISLYCFLPW